MKNCPSILNHFGQEGHHTTSTRITAKGNRGWKVGSIVPIQAAASSKKLCPTEKAGVKDVWQ